jgi:hypothetical protein
MSAVLSVAALGAALLLSADEPRAQSVAAASIPDEAEERANRTLEFLFHGQNGPPVVHLDAHAIDSVGTAMSEKNLAIMARVDDEYRRGAYGKPGSDEARSSAVTTYLFRAETAFDFFLQLALQDSVIYSTSEADLKEAFTERFRNPGLYPIVNLIDARTGCGKFGCSSGGGPTPRELEV